MSELDKKQIQTQLHHFTISLQLKSICIYYKPRQFKEKQVKTKTKVFVIICVICKTFSNVIKYDQLNKMVTLL